MNKLLRFKDFMSNRFKGIGNEFVSYKSPGMITIVHGYLKAVDNLISPFKDQLTTAGDDLLVFPSMFLLRHALELSLKLYIVILSRHIEIARLMSEQLNNRCKNVLGEHALIRLFNVTVDLLKLSPTHRDPQFLTLRRFFEDFNNYDSDGMTFRYPIKKTGKQIRFYEKQRNLDVLALSNTVTGICAHIEWVVRQDSIGLYDIGMLNQESLNCLKESQIALKQISKGIPKMLLNQVRSGKSTAFKLHSFKSAEDWKEYHKNSIELTKFKNYLGKFATRRILLALYGYYIGRDGFWNETFDQFSKCWNRKGAI